MKLKTTGELPKSFKKHKPPYAHYVAVALGSLAAALSASGIAASLTDPVIIVGAPHSPPRRGGRFLRGCCCRAYKPWQKISLKITKHENNSFTSPFQRQFSLNVFKRNE